MGAERRVPGKSRGHASRILAYLRIARLPRVGGVVTPFFVLAVSSVDGVAQLR